MQDDVGGDLVLARALEAPAAEALDKALVHVVGRGGRGSDLRPRRARVGMEDAEAVRGRRLDEGARGLEELDPALDLRLGRGRQQAVSKRAACGRRRLQRPAEREDEAAAA